MSNVWDSFYQGEQGGERIGGNIRNARAYRSGGLPAVADAAAQSGDLATTENVRQFQDEQTKAAYERMQTIGPWAQNVVKAASARAATDPEGARAFLQQNQQRFLDFGFTPDQVNAGIAGLTDPNPATRQQWADQLDAAFSQHQDPAWSIRGNQVVGIDHGSGAVTIGGTVPEDPHWETNGTTPYYVDSSGRTHLGSGEIPRPPPASMIIAGGNTPDIVNYTADAIESGRGSAIQGEFNRNPQLAQAVTAELARRHASGDARADPTAVGQAAITYHALARSTDQLTTQANSVQRAAGAVRNNIQTAIGLMRTLQNNRSPIVNQGWQAWANATGDPHASDVRAARIALEGTMAEYARQVTGMYGAGSAPETEMRNYRDQLNQADNMQTIMQVFNSMLTLMDNVDNSYNQQLMDMRNGQGAGGGASLPPPPPPGGAPTRPANVPPTARWDPATRHWVD